jgi:glyoxylase-like metal-dependent hydrolase (beta-lactamase superfamily II)
LDEGQLFVGDILTNRTKPAGALFVENEDELRDSLEKLKRAKARVVYPGHGKPFSFLSLVSMNH